MKNRKDIFFIALKPMLQAVASTELATKNKKKENNFLGRHLFH